MATIDFLKTKNAYYSGVAGLMGGAMGGEAWHTALISSAIAAIDLVGFPEEYPAHIGKGKWFAGNLLSSTASGLIAWGVGHAISELRSKKQPGNFAERENERRAATPCDCEKTR